MTWPTRSSTASWAVSDRADAGDPVPLTELLSYGGMALLVLVWLSNLMQVIRTTGNPPYRLRADTYAGPVQGAPLLSVIIPARNEERNIGACLDALAASDHDKLEIVVVDDRSEDKTRLKIQKRQAREVDAPRIRLVEGEGPPPGWMGKIAAVWHGQKHASGKYLLFLDADVRVSPSGIRQCLHYIADKGVDGVSVIGFLVNDTFWERVIQPVVGSLILTGNRPENVNDPDKRDAMANGQFILVSREAYDAVGGHEAIQGEVLDDVVFARLMKSEGRRLHLLYGREIFGCRMYDGLSEIWEGWSKNLFPGLHHSLSLTAFVCGLVFTTALLPFLLLPWFVATAGPGAPMTALAAGVVALIYATYAYGLHENGQPAGSFWTYPLGVAAMLAIIANSAVSIRFGKGVTWKGRRLTDTGGRGPKVVIGEAPPGLGQDADRDGQEREAADGEERGT